MSAREWFPSPDGIGENTGEFMDTGCGYVYPFRGRYQATAYYGRASMSQPAYSMDAGKRIVEGFLSEREAEKDGGGA